MSKLRLKDAVAVLLRLFNLRLAPSGAGFFRLKSEEIPVKHLITGFLLFGMLAMAGMSEAKGHRIHGYYRANGHYVKSYYRSRANHTKCDNYSYKGNYNPYTGKRGH